MFKKILLLIFMFLFLIVFGFGYTHNVLIDKYEITSEDTQGYIRYFTSAKDIGVNMVQTFNNNWESFVDSIKPFTFQLSWYFENISFTTIFLFLGDLAKLLFYPINLLLKFLVLVFNQIATANYYFVQFIFWASGFRRLL